MDTVKAEKQKKVKVTGYKYWLQQQCKKAGGHTYTMRSQWGITWTECVCCGARIVDGRKIGELADEYVDEEEVIEETE